MKIVITGGAGFIGSNLAKYFQNNNDVLVIDCFNSNERFSNGNFKAFGDYKNLLNFNGDIYCGDICDKSTIDIIEKFNPDVIFHQAAISDTTVKEQNAIMQVNVNAFKMLLEFCLKNNTKLIYASSAAVYGNEASPQKVYGSENPKNAYGFSKLMMDKIAQKHCKSHKNAKVIGLRYFNVYGSGEFYKGKTASMILQFGLQILQNKTAKLFDKSDEIFRDFVYIKDVVRANELAIYAPNGIYNVATSIPRTFNDIVDILSSQLQICVKKEYIRNPYVKNYQFYTQADLTLSKQFLKYEPKFSLEDGIKDYLNDIKNIFESEINA